MRKLCPYPATEIQHFPDLDDVYVNIPHAKVSRDIRLSNQPHSQFPFNTGPKP